MNGAGEAEGKRASTPSSSVIFVARHPSLKNGSHNTDQGVPAVRTSIAPSLGNSTPPSTTSRDVGTTHPSPLGSHSHQAVYPSPPLSSSSPPSPHTTVTPLLSISPCGVRATPAKDGEKEPDTDPDTTAPSFSPSRVRMAIPPRVGRPATTALSPSGAGRASQSTALRRPPWREVCIHPPSSLPTAASAAVADDHGKRASLPRVLLLLPQGSAIVEEEEGPPRERCGTPSPPEGAVGGAQGWHAQGGEGGPHGSTATRDDGVRGSPSPMERGVLEAERGHTPTEHRGRGGTSPPPLTPLFTVVDRPSAHRSPPPTTTTTKTKTKKKKKIFFTPSRNGEKGVGEDRRATKRTGGGGGEGEGERGDPSGGKGIGRSRSIPTVIESSRVAPPPSTDRAFSLPLSSPLLFSTTTSTSTTSDPSPPLSSSASLLPLRLPPPLLPVGVAQGSPAGEEANGLGGVVAAVAVESLPGASTLLSSSSPPPPSPTLESRKASHVKPAQNGTRSTVLGRGGERPPPRQRSPTGGVNTTTTKTEEGPEANRTDSPSPRTAGRTRTTTSTSRVVPKTGGLPEKKKPFTTLSSAAGRRPATTTSTSFGKRLDATSVDAHRLAAHKEQRRREMYAWNAAMRQKVEKEGSADGSADAV